MMRRMMHHHPFVTSVLLVGVPIVLALWINAVWRTT